MNVKYGIVVLVLITFFMVSFMTNILGPIFPELVDDFNIGITLAGFFPFAFFVAYAVMSIPAGLLVQARGEKPVMLLAFTLAGAGSLSFALSPSFLVAMFALFTIGCAMALLQVAINPLLRVSGGSKHFAMYSVLAQLMFGGAATLSPIVYSSFVEGITLNKGVGRFFIGLVPSSMAWLSMYWLFAALCLGMVVYILFTPIAKVDRNCNELLSVKQSLALLKNPIVVKFFFAIVAYVALEQGIANSISLFLQSYHGLDAHTHGAYAVSQFWLLLTVGCLIGLLFLKFFDAQKLLMIFSMGAASALLLALFGSKSTSLLSFSAVGFFLSIMWSVLFSLALNSMQVGHGAVAGILCTGIVGGAIASPILGLLSELIGSQQIAMLVLLIPLGYIFSVGIWAKPLINNHTVSLFNRRTEVSQSL
ncbi:MFS transporter [Pseudoalteromonas aurantia]|uniref:MFS transporter n=1 Tax=Pseudoalteromonas aurantia TaxID=43654 RepID=A0ABY2W274_9GAMM|nr:MFS transporter [Pseudoalteromonas aurantia]TMO62032.1 MFS transporter [Pseudoalteromonas aurantia]TMO78459.1 MFS transporter [Pseudoalteromonas aurantia]